PGQQVLDAVGGRVAQVLGRLPAVLPLRLAEPPADGPHRPPARLAPNEPPTDPLAHGLELPGPFRHPRRRRPPRHCPPSPQLRAGPVVLTTAVGLIPMA